MSITKQRILYVVTDYLSTLAAVLVFTAFRFHLVGELAHTYESISAFYKSEGVILTMVFFPLFMLALYCLSGYYISVIDKSRMKEFIDTAVCVLIGAVSFFMIVLINDAFPERLYNYELILVLAVVMFVFIYGARVSVTTISKRLLRTEAGIRKIVVISADEKCHESKALDSLLEGEGMRPVAWVNISKSQDINSENELRKLMDSMEVDGFLLNIPADERYMCFRILDILFPYELPIYITPYDYELVMSKVRYDNVLSEPLIDISRSDFPDHVLAMKRFSDILVSFIGLAVLTPVIFALGVAVKMQSPGPVIYSQERIGYHKRPFNIYKLRSMYDGAEADSPLLSGKDDSRVTPIGKFMRKYRLDELPNLWNVLCGDMSIVGPRPERKYFIDRILQSAPYYSLLHQVRPGLTSWGMVKYGYASSVDEMIERLRYDILYIQNLTPSLDFKIIFYTFRTLVRGEGI